MLLNEKNICGVSVFCRCFVLGCLLELCSMTICESNRSQTILKRLPATWERAAVDTGVCVCAAALAALPCWLGGCGRRQRAATPLGKNVLYCMQS